MSVRTFHSQDPDEAMSAFGQAFFDHRLTRTRSPFGFDLTAGEVGHLKAGILMYDQEISAESHGMRYSVAVPLKGAFNLGIGRVSVAVDPTTAAVSTANRPVNIRGWSKRDDSVFLLGIDPTVMADHLRRLLARDVIGDIHFAPSLNLRTGYGAQWWHMTRAIAIALRSPHQLSTNPMMSKSLSSTVMTGLLLSVDHPYRDALEAWTRPVRPRTVRRAIDVIEQRAHEPLTVAEIAEAVGCSVRALQVSFKKHLDETPAEHLRRVRIDRAHTMLRFANPATTTVAEIAYQWGFKQPGRFSAHYRKHYGISPTVTLRQ